GLVTPAVSPAWSIDRRSMTTRPDTFLRSREPFDARLPGHHRLAVHPAHGRSHLAHDRGAGRSRHVHGADHRHLDRVRDLGLAVVHERAAYALRMRAISGF